MDTDPENPETSTPGQPTPDSPAPPDQPASASPESDAPTYNHSRTGRIARLPKELRDKVNQMLLDGVPFRRIIESLGDAGKEINEDNVGDWKKGGYKEWLLEMQRVDDLSRTRDAAQSLIRQKAGATVQDAGRTIASAQLYELLLSFDPRRFAAALADKPELYFRLVNSLARLSEGEAVCSRLRAQAMAIERQLENNEGGEGSAIVSAEKLKEILRLIKLL